MSNVASPLISAFRNNEHHSKMEKLNGRFELKFKKALSTPHKIEKLAAEETAFHLHKKRNFLRKI
jgi:hypothetical protein